jgi:hypothetical protein
MAEVQQQKIAALEKKVGSGGKSPLFAQLASFYVQQGKPTEALRLCDEGLAVFPHYTTGHLIKGKALLALQMNAEARREFELVGDFLPANEMVAFILSNIQSGEGEMLVSPSVEPEVLAPTLEAPQPTLESAVAPPSEEPAPGFTVPEAVEPTQPANLFEAVGQTPQSVEDPFGFGSASGSETTPPADNTAVEENPNPFEGFPDQAQLLESPEGISKGSESQSGSIFDFPLESQQTLAAPGEESFESFSARRRGELVGENTMTLEDYLVAATNDQGSTQQEPSPRSSETIENLAEKLQSAKKITPVINLSTKATIPASETDTPASTGFVTPTLAEIYAKQGWYDDAIKAYRTLCINKPAEKDRFEKRISELEDLKKQQG